MFDGGKLVIRHFDVAPKDFAAVEEMVRDLAVKHSTTFDRRDFRHVRTSEDFKKAITGGKEPPPPMPPPLPGGSS
jgi:hypothetical protein